MGKIKKHKNYIYTFIIVLLLLFMSAGYATLKSNETISGSVSVNAAFYNVTLVGVNTTLSPSGNVRVLYGGRLAISVTPKNGYILDNITCDDDFTVESYQSGLNTYYNTQIVYISNDNHTNGTCMFTSRQITAEEVAYSHSGYSFTNSDQALDYLYTQY